MGPDKVDFLFYKSMVWDTGVGKQKVQTRKNCQGTVVCEKELLVVGGWGEEK